MPEVEKQANGQESGIPLRYQVFWVIIGFAILTWFTYQAMRSREELIRVQKTLEAVQKELADLEEKTQDQLMELRGLERDPFLIEERIREKTGLVRPGEIPLADSDEPPAQE